MRGRGPAGCGWTLLDPQGPGTTLNGVERSDGEVGNWLGNWFSTAVIASSTSTWDLDGEEVFIKTSIQEMKTRSPTGEAALLKGFLDVLETSEASDIENFILNEIHTKGRPKCAQGDWYIGES